MKKILILALFLAPISMFAQKFAHFNSADVVQAMPEYATSQKELQDMQKQYEDDLKRQQDELNKKTQEFQTQRDSLPENVRQRREQELTELYQRIRQSYEDNQQALQKASNDKMQTITNKVLEAVKSIGQSEGYIYIMDATSGIPFINSTLSKDITAQVKQKLGVK